MRIPFSAAPDFSSDHLTQRRWGEATTTGTRANDWMDSLDCTGRCGDIAERPGLCGPIPLRRRSAEARISVRELYRGAAGPGVEDEQRRHLRPRSRDRKAPLYRLRRVDRRRPRPPRRHPAIPGVLWRRGPKPE